MSFLKAQAFGFDLGFLTDLKQAIQKDGIQFEHLNELNDILIGNVEPAAVTKDSGPDIVAEDKTFVVVDVGG